jgi:hypothetical protein
MSDTEGWQLDRDRVAPRRSIARVDRWHAIALAASALLFIAALVILRTIGTCSMPDILYVLTDGFGFPFAKRGHSKV